MLSDKLALDILEIGHAELPQPRAGAQGQSSASAGQQQSNHGVLRDGCSRFEFADFGVTLLRQVPQSVSNSPPGISETLKP
jgi:hypothetical protein